MRITDQTSIWLRRAILTLVVLIPSSTVLFLVATVVRLASSSECDSRELTAEIKAWQSASRYEREVILDHSGNGLDLWNTPDGPFWTVHEDKVLPFLLREQFADVYEPEGHEVRPGDVVLDCGANIGMFTRKALQRGAKQVIAVEPSPPTLEALRKNLAAEIADGRVVIIPKGVWNKDGEMELSINPANEGMNSLVIEQAMTTTRKVKVPLTTIDHLMAELNVQRIDFIKMDIEGAEKQALEGGRESIRRFRPRMTVSSEHLPDDFTAIPALVHSIDPRYSMRGCYCSSEQGKLRAQALAFDPKS